MNASIYEDRLDGLWTDDEKFSRAREDVMKELYGEEAEEKIKRTDYYISKWLQQRASINEHLIEWEDIDRLSKSERETNGLGEETAFVNVITPNVEGQVASMTNYNISASVKGRGVGDQMFAKSAEPIVSFILERNDIRNLVKEAGRKYVKYGNVFASVGWNPEAFDGMGMPEIRIRSLSEILIDGKIRDPRQIDNADYIIEEVGQMSILWAEREYGEKIAKAIQTGNSVQDFAEKYEMDDNESFTMLRVWTKVNEQGNMQMLLLSACGIMLEESSADEPYYSKVFNRYPVFYAGLYPSEGEFYHYGDGKLLKPIQELINKLYDEIILSIKFASQGRTYIDPQAKVKPDEFAECDPSKFVVCASPNSMVKTERGAGINDGVYSILSDLFARVQEVTRFSTLMTGQSGESRTATEAGILMQQGATGIDDKKGDISKLLSDSVLYAFALCLENWSAGVALRVADEGDDFVWIDTEQLNRIPKMIPASQQYISEWRKSQKSKKNKMPKWMALEVENETATSQILIDLSLSIGEGMPTNKISMYNVILSLSQLMLIDEVTGQPTPLLSKQKVIDMIEDILGIVISDEDQKNMQMQQMPMQQATQQPINQSPNVPMANINGSLAGGGVR